MARDTALMPSRPATARPGIVAVAVAALGLAGCSHHRAAAPTTISTVTTTSTTTTTAPPSPSTAPGGLVLPAGASILAAPATPDAAARDLIAANATFADPAASAGGLAEAAAREVAAYHAAAAHSGWPAAINAALPSALRARVSANIGAAVELRALTAPRTALPPWHIVDPAPATELRADYDAASAATGIPWPYLAAVNLVETRMGRIRGPSTAGARGPMQFLPSTWARYGNGGNIENAHDAIAAAARLLAADGGPADMGKALFAYNHSQHYVKAITAYAQQMQSDANAFRAYHSWPVVYRMVTGDILLDSRYVGI